MAQPLLQTYIPSLALYGRGKVRDTYDLNDKLLIVATDRISAFDSILPTGIPGKGEVLTQMSAFWFRRTAGIQENHMITADFAEFPEDLKPFEDQLAGRSMLVKKAQRIDIECVVRGYLAGSGWAEYKRSQTICGIKLPAGLRESEKLPEPIFTPSTKAESGHDMNISIEEMGELVGPVWPRELRDKSLRVYATAERYARAKGIIIADTKVEYGLLDGKVILIDELLTPDSSRFWDTASYEPGRSQPSLDKQYVRDWLEASGWDKEPPAPPLPEDVVQKTSEKYWEAYRRLTSGE
ncbi:MAG: phosphoribosylaminoimidazolesuccinocarboxamide synthase [Chloroflexi bacterium]|nr:phosphoribosylaminoimidazolesuccinocarboxamide synthase [Chloroflexota bacterium]